MILSVFLSAALAQEAPPIVNGSNTQNFRAVGALTIKQQNSYYSFCSGTFLSSMIEYVDSEGCEQLPPFCTFEPLNRQ